jgi:putative membrane protein insertion efficiency factor
MKPALLTAIRFYQRRISPGLRPSCRFQPTCSEYAAEAIASRGAARGLALAAWRLLRCNPLNDGGFDPVPEPGPAGHPQRTARP